jgi:hypothetical protein
MSVLDLYQMSNLSPLFTGLPFVVWISPRGHAKHDVRIKVARTARAVGPFVSVALRPHVHVVTPQPAFRLNAKELDLIQQWFALNRRTLLDFWDGRIQYTEQALAALQPLKPRGDA